MTKNVSMTLNYNQFAHKTQRYLTLNNGMLSKSIEQLSSGYRINVASDDPSGLVMSEQLRNQIASTNRAIRNSTEAQNMIGIAEGALNEVNEIWKKLKSLALHAANSGVTSTEQIRADQAEFDSAVQTIDRIAAATKYSDQFLLNGSKGLVYDRTTIQKNTMDNALIDLRNTRIDQIYKRDGSEFTVGYNGISNSTSPDASVQARRAIFEADPAVAGTQISGGTLTSNQNFIITGPDGTRSFNYSSGEKIGNIVRDINNLSSSLGASAQLIFSSDVTPSTLTYSGYDPDTNGQSRVVGAVEVYGANLNDSDPDRHSIGSVIIGGRDSNGNATNPSKIGDRLIPGVNLDGSGNIYCEVAYAMPENPPSREYERTVEFRYYKDAECTTLVGLGVFTVEKEIDADGNETLVKKQSFVPVNDSGLKQDDIIIEAGPAIQKGDVYTLSFAGLECVTPGLAGDNDGMNLADFNMTGLNDNYINIDQRSVVTGVNLGHNTDDTGSLHFVATGPADNRTIKVYKNSLMRAEDLVAYGQMDLSSASRSNPITMRLEAVTMENGESSGLNISLTFQDVPSVGEEQTKISFDQIGMRLYSNDYGSQEYVQIQNNTGQMWGQYRRLDTQELVLVESGAKAMQYGGDAVISLNGGAINTSGLSANVTTPDLSGQIGFEAGTLGATTIAQTGHEFGTIFSRAGAIQAQSDTLLMLDTTIRSTASGYTTLFIDNEPGNANTVAHLGNLQLDLPDDATGPYYIAVENGSSENMRKIVIYTTPEGSTGSKVAESAEFDTTLGAQAALTLNPVAGNADAISGTISVAADILVSMAGISIGLVPMQDTAPPGVSDLRLNSPSGQLNTQTGPYYLVIDYENGSPTNTVAKLYLGGPGTENGGVLVAQTRAVDTTKGDMLDQPLIPEPGQDINGLVNLAMLCPETADAVVDPDNPSKFTNAVEVYIPKAANIFTYATNARHATSETLDNFSGGMQYQLGTGSGDQERTVYSIQSMAVANLGQIEVDNTLYSLADCQAGGKADLANDPILALKIIEQAIVEVTSLRARLGSFQSNMLQANINSLNVAVENLTKTESAIRDTDMAAASTQFASSQIATQAATAMLAQANLAQQNIIQLLSSIQ